MKIAAIILLGPLGLAELAIRCAIFGGLCIIVVGVALAVELSDNGTNIFEPTCWALMARIVDR